MVLHHYSILLANIVLTGACGVGLIALFAALGIHHLSTLESQHNLALLLGYELGQIGQAIATMSEVVEGWTAALGSSDKTTKAAAKALADWKAHGRELGQRDEL